MAIPIRVIRGVEVFGASAQSSTDTAPSDFTAFASTTAAFARNCNTHFGSAYPDATTTSSQDGWNLGAYARVTADDTITFNRYASASSTNTRLAWEALEYTGAASGANEFIVRGIVSISMAGGTGTAQSSPIADIDSLAKCVAFPLGFIHETSGTNRNWHRAACTFTLTTSGSDDVVQAQRGNTTDAITAWCVVVEFTGSNWVVENNISHTFSAAATNETKSITDVVDTTKAFVVGSMRTSNSAECSLACNVWFKDSDELYLRRQTGATGTGVWVGSVVRNDAILNVGHYDSITGSLSDLNSTDNTQTRDLASAVASLDHSMLICTSNSSVASNAYPSAFVNYRFTDLDTVEFFTPRTGATHDITIQAIEFLDEGGGSAIAPIAAYLARRRRT